MIFKQVFRLAFVTFVWKQYKAWIVSTVILLACIFIIGQVHADLLQVWEMNKDTSHTSISLLYKWIAYIFSISIYCCYHIFRSKKSPRDIVKDKQRTDKEERKLIEKELSELPSDKDPFNAIRQRGKLRSRSDFIIGNEKKDPNDSE